MSACPATTRETPKRLPVFPNVPGMTTRLAARRRLQNKVAGAPARCGRNRPTCFRVTRAFLVLELQPEVHALHPEIGRVEGEQRSGRRRAAARWDVVRVHGAVDLF